VHDPEPVIPGISEPDRQAFQRRTLSVLFASSVFGRGAMTTVFVVAALLVEEILGSGTWAGLSVVAITVGTAFSSSYLAKMMLQRGRRPALVIGYSIAVAGSLIALLSGQMALSRNSAALLPVLLIGMVLFGVGQGASNLSRYAASDLAHPDKRSQAIGLVVFASTAGAVGGPALAGLAGKVAQRVDFYPLVGPFMFSLAFFSIAGFILWTSLRPDPLVLSGGVDKDKTVARPSFRDGVGYIRQSRMAMLAVVGLVISQAVMVMVMTMTPRHMTGHEHDLGWVGHVISAHTAGMFAFAPLAGWVADKVGKMKTLMISAVVLMIATGITAAATNAELWMMLLGLYLLGLGWSFGVVAGSSLLTESVEPTHRVPAQGAADVIASLTSGIGALASGVVVTYAGFDLLSVAGVVGAAILLAVTLHRYWLSPVRV